MRGPRRHAAQAIGHTAAHKQRFAIAEADSRVGRSAIKAA